MASAKTYESRLGKMFDLSGKVSIVTGGNRGIGRGLALGLAEGGAAVAILPPDEEKNEATLQELLSLGVPAIALRGDLKGRRGLKPPFDEGERKHRPRVRGAAQGNDSAYAARALGRGRGTQRRGGLPGLFGLRQHDRRRFADRRRVLDSLNTPDTCPLASEMSISARVF